MVKRNPIRLGGHISEKFSDPRQWSGILKRLGYSAAYCPVGVDADPKLVREYAEEARRQDIVISEVGVWKNAISFDEQVRSEALALSKESLHLADLIGANCCVNVSGSLNPEHWAGPHKDNLTKDTFDLVVDMAREIIDAVKPTKTFFALEPMPWSFPDTVDSYVRLLKGVDRKHFGVHLDPMNLISSPQLYFRNGDLIKECFEKLGPHIRSCHAKDISLREDIYVPQFSEVRIGLGSMDYGTFLREVSRWPDLPLMLEHLPDAEQYRLAAEEVRRVASENGLTMHGSD
jgi:sugar phosphate isomerase/epimerase